MKNIMMAWELGGGLGHVANRFAVRDTLRQRGHQVALALRDLGTLYRLRPEVAEPVFAAPNPPGMSIAAVRPLLSFADVLWHDAGLHDPAICAGVISAWRSLLAHTQCDLLLADAAPMATVAAKSLGIPVLRYGISFLNPPTAAPFPVFRDWEQHDAGYLPQLEARSVEHINSALGRLGGPLVESLAQACADAPLLLESLPEMDLYGPRNTVANMPSVSTGVGQIPIWPAGDEPRVFCYLKHDYPWLERLLGALARAPARSSVFIDGAMPGLPAGAPIHLHATPVDAASAIAQSDVVICSAGSGMINQALLAGKPLLLLPMQAEQYLNARRVVQFGAGLSVTPPIDKPEFLAPLRRLLSEPGLTASAQAIAARHVAMAGQDSSQKIADIIESHA
ncbi:MAG: glycosyltransferase [Pseudomonadota bacterium]|nr:glycosyltransferase [Pseudomonadota bacterium]